MHYHIIKKKLQEVYSTKLKKKKNNLRSTSSQNPGRMLNPVVIAPSCLGPCLHPVFVFCICLWLSLGSGTGSGSKGRGRLANLTVLALTLTLQLQHHLNDGQMMCCVMCTEGKLPIQCAWQLVCTITF